MAKVIETRIDQLIPDDKNFNAGTQYGQSLLETSLRKFGAGRSILIDKNNRIIAGNKTVENAAAIDLDDVIVVETNGSQLVAVKRTDIDLESAQGRELALADNATSAANLQWDADAIMEKAAKFEFIPDDWGVELGEPDTGGDDADQGGGEKRYQVIIDCKDDAEMERIAQRLRLDGYECHTT